MVRDLRDRRILVTGSSSGIGRALAEQAARAGARVGLMARSREPLEQLERQLRAEGCHALALCGDVTSEADRQRVLDAMAEQWGGLDVLINNAGVGSWGHFADSSEAILRQVMEVNYFAPAEMIRLAIPLLTEGREPAVVNVASMCGRLGMPAWSEYSASKFALCGLTEALRGELARFDIDVLLVLPGLTASDYQQHLIRKDGRAAIEFDKGMPPEKVAAQILKSLRKSKAETVVGSDARWMLRVNRFFPRLVRTLLARKVKKLYQQG